MRRSRESLSKLVSSAIDAYSLAQLHSVLFRSGLAAAADCFFATRLAVAYSNLGHVGSARRVFDEIPHPNTFLYNAILRAHSRARQWPEALVLFCRMARSRLVHGRPDEFTFSAALRACAALGLLSGGRAIHGAVLKMHRACSDMFVGSALVEMYSKCGEMGDALLVFDGFSEPDVVLRTSMVTGYQQNGYAEEAVSFFSKKVVGEHVVPGPITLVSVVSAIVQLGDLRAGKSCHGFLIRMGFESELSLVNSILNLYTKVGTVGTTRKLFDTMPRKDVISWSCMISCCAQNGNPAEALDVYKTMLAIGIEPSSITLVSVLQACALSLDLHEGRKVHEIAAQRGYNSELAVSTALIDMYMKCSSCREAIEIFDLMPKKDIVAWAAVIGGYAENGLPEESLKLFQKMLMEKASLDAVTVVKVLMACSQMGILNQALCLHGYLVNCGFNNKVFVAAALIDLYSKCGSLHNAVKVFKSISEKDVVIWSAMIAGYGMHGFGREAIATFKHMIQASIKPNAITFVSVLSACSHAGLTKDGIRIFNKMSHVYGVTPTSEHYSILVDLLGRNGELQEARKLIEGMPVPVGPHVWCALLAGCMTHHNIDMGEMVARKLLELEPEHAGYYNLFSNIYAFEGKWEKMAGVKSLLKERGVRKVAGYSSVEVDNEVHTFLAGERNRVQEGWEKLCGLLRELTVKMREDDGCVHDTHIEMVKGAEFFIET